MQPAIKTINSVTDIKTFFDHLFSMSLLFHPDDSFTEYINVNTGERTFTDSEAEQYNDVMNTCHQYCESNGLDIYEIAIEHLNEWNAKN